jgi:hypothetical protein
MAKKIARVGLQKGDRRQPAQQSSRVFSLVQVPLAVALVSAASMIGEIALTRLFSVVLPYYFVYVILSVAILGLGLGALGGHWQRERIHDNAVLALMPMVAGLTALFLVLVFVVTASQSLWLPYLVLSCVLFAFVGVFVSQVFSTMVDRSGWLYWADLTGAAFGVLAALLALTAVGAVNALLLTAFLLAIASILYRLGSRLTQAAGVILGLLFILNLGFGFVDLDIAHSQNTKTIAVALDPNGLGGEVMFSDWDAYARTDVVAYSELPDERTLFVDGGAGSAVFRLEGDLEDLAYLRNDLGYMSFRLIEPNSALIIGPGGGKDIALALLGATPAITAVEINPGIVRALDYLSEYNGNLHRHPSVELRVAEGRSFLKSEGRSYDLIYLSLVANEAADLAGLVLAENYVYTEDAFLDYLHHLTPHGAVVLRLHDEPHLNRAFATALQAMGSEGLSSAQAMQQIVVIAGAPRPDSPAAMDPLLVVLASPLSPSAATHLLEMVKTARAFPLFIPHSWEEMPYAAFAEGRIEIDEFVARLSGSYAAPTTDDRPFFYLLEGGLPEELRQLALLLALAVLGWASYIYFSSRRYTFAKGRVLWWAYFAALGLGFMLVEVALIQRFSLFLGHPVRSLAVVLGGLLLATGLGSFAVRNRTGAQALMFVRWSSIGIVLLGILYLALLPLMLPVLHGTALVVRILVALCTVMPLGLLLGMPFPLGLRLLATQQAADDVALAWASNGLFAVAGSVLAMIVAIQFGFSLVWVMGLTSYLVVLVLLWVSMKV